MTKQDHARLREYRDRVGQRVAAGEPPSEQLGRQVAEEMAQTGTPIPAEVQRLAGWAA